MARISLDMFDAAPRQQDGVRPVDLGTDLRPIADLIELAFSDSMDSAGRSAIREMRYLSHLGFVLRLIARFNSLAEGLNLGFVYIDDGELVGNVSMYPGNYPRELGETWMLANVAVHPSRRGRGIAGKLLACGIESLRKRGAKRVILQVDVANDTALKLYEAHGFVRERAWVNWRRSSRVRGFASTPHDFHITRLRRHEREAEYRLAQAARPNDRGGLGWQKPLRKDDFCPSPWRELRMALSMQGVEKLVIRGDNPEEILACCWLENPAGFGRVLARMFTSPQIDHTPYAEALIGNLTARYERSTILFEHPRDDDVVSDLLKRRGFKVKRELWHMRLDM